MVDDYLLKFSKGSQLWKCGDTEGRGGGGGCLTDQPVRVKAEGSG